jgi:hypothetical protein
MLRLAIRDSSGERVFATERGEILVGSREGVDLRLADPAAAPNHCILRAEGGRVRLMNLAAGGAAPGGGRGGGEALLDPGAEFLVGSTAVRVLACAGATARLELVDPPAPPPKPPPPGPPAAGDADFAREVRATLAKAPWYLLSLVVHVAILLLMRMVVVTEAPAERIAHLTSLPRREMPEPEVPPDAPLDLRELENARDHFDEIDFEEPLSAAVRKDPSDAEFSEFEDIVPPDHLGLGDGRRPLRPLDKPLPYSKVKGGDETLDRGDIPGEHGRATDEVKRGLGDGLAKARQRLTREHIVVVSGAHDKIETVLDGYEWPYTLVTRDQLLMHGAPKARILFVNCSNRPSPALNKKLAELVKRLLARGCWVVTSDWSVDPYLTVAFPHIVTAVGSRRSQRDTTVAVEPVGDDLLLAGVFPRGGESAWWLEDSSTMVDVKTAEGNPPAVGQARATVLIASEDMKKRYGSGVVAFKLPYGDDGLVVHLVGHFYQKDGNLHGLVAMHRLINNLIVERVLADQKR